MKRIIILFFTIVTVFTAYSQDYLDYAQYGDSCFDKSEYECAFINYSKAFQLAIGSEKQTVEIKLNRARNCAKWMKTAEQAFNEGNNELAKENYQYVLGSNKKDEYAIAQLKRIDTAPDSSQNLNNTNVITQPESKTTLPLRKATADDIADIWNNKYGVLPERRQRLIAAGIDPIDAQKRINAGEGKPATEMTLSVSKQNISFISSGARAMIDVKTNASDYQITNLPSWCTVHGKYSDWFSLSCTPNNTGQSRSSWFNVIAGDKIAKINVNQATDAFSSNYSNRTTNSNSTYSKQTTYPKRKKYSCFNCPQTKYPVGFSVGYVEKNLNYFDNNTGYYYDKLEGIQAGFRIEPLFKYGFGLNMGVFYEFYSKSIEQSYNYGDSYDNYVDIYTVNYKQHIINIPLHLEYRLNFSRYFSLFIYGGASVDIPISDDFGSSAYALFDYGGGLRIDHVQFNIGTSNIISDLSNSINYDLFSNKYKNLMASMSYMF